MHTIAVNTALITSRRNFLTRALGFTAAGATLAVPILALPSPEDRLKHHMAGAAAAFRDLFPGVKVDVRGNCLDGRHDYFQEMFRDRPAERHVACAMIFAGPIQAGGDWTYAR